ncbi:hypothetical protein D0A35_07810 [Xanthomonas campestris]|nr:hypothetical protein D0A35_07810 [Xanthomonas campestris]
MSVDYQLTLSQDEALVLFELFSRFADTGQLALRHTAEFVALSRISGQLDKSLVQPFSADYSLLLAQAQSRVAAGYQGLAPGVSGDGA